jgi:hypothetical protein
MWSGSEFNDDQKAKAVAIDDEVVRVPSDRNEVEAATASSGTRCRDFTITYHARYAENGGTVIANL